MKSLKTMVIAFFLLLPFLQAQEKQTLKFEFFLRDTDNENYVITLPYGMAFDKEESVYILDFKECNILKFSKDGKYITTIGRRGRGPGELYLPGCITVQNDKLYYVDVVNLVNVYDANGKVIKSERKGSTGYSLKAYPEEFIVGPDFDKKKNSDFLKIWDWGGDEINVIDEISLDKYMKTLKKDYKILTIAATNTDTFAYNINGRGAVIYAKTNKYEIFKWFDGKRESIIKEKHTYKLLPNEKRKKNRLEKKKGIITLLYQQ